jgi:hypothetical protein
MSFSDGSSFRGSAFFVTPRHLVSAAHNFLADNGATLLEILLSMNPNAVGPVTAVDGDEDLDWTDEAIELKVVWMHSNLYPTESDHDFFIVNQTIQQTWMANKDIALLEVVGPYRSKSFLNLTAKPASGVCITLGFEGHPPRTYFRDEEVINYSTFNKRPGDTLMVTCGAASSDPGVKGANFVRLGVIHNSAYSGTSGGPVVCERRGFAVTVGVWIGGNFDTNLFFPFASPWLRQQMFPYLAAYVDKDDAFHIEPTKKHIFRVKIHKEL